MNNQNNMFPQNPGYGSSNAYQQPYPQSSQQPYPQSSQQPYPQSSQQPYQQPYQQSNVPQVIGHPYNATHGNMSFISEQEWKDAANGHLLTAILTIFGFGLITSVILYFVNKNKGALVRSEMGKSLSFQLYVLAGYFISGLLSVVIIGDFLIPLLWIASFVISFVARSACSNRRPSNFFLPAFIR